MVILIVLLGFVKTKSDNAVCKDVQIKIDYRNADKFINPEDIRTYIFNAIDSLPGLSRSEIDVDLIEETLKKNPYVANAEAYVSIAGNVNINIIQRNAIVRIIDNKNKSYFVDEKGAVMTSTPNYSARILIANGNIKGNSLSAFNNNLNLNIDSLGSNSMIYAIYKIAEYIFKDDFLRAQFDQIYVNESGDIELIPKVGNHYIIFGNAENIKKKFDKLIIFYEKGLNKIGWDKYERINLKYKDQVICTKKTNTYVDNNS